MADFLHLESDPDLRVYLLNDEVTDGEDPAVQAQAALLRGQDTAGSIANCYYFCRDNIAHSVDIAEKERITVTASEVLKYGHGLCMAKAHLFAALLRVLNIPAGFCYQTLVQPSIRFVHGLNAVYDTQRKQWYRIDIVGRHSKEPLSYTPGQDLLFYTPRRNLQIIEHPWIYSKPHPTALSYLRGFHRLADALEHLPENL